MKKSAIALFVMLVFTSTLFFVAVSPAFATGTVDQAVTGTSTNTFIINTTQSQGQVFTAGRSGVLDRVTVDLYKDGNVGIYYVEIYATSNGLPTGSALATEAKSESTLTTSPASVIVDFSSPISVVSGTQYALVVRAPNVTQQYNPMMQGFSSSYLNWRAEPDQLSSDPQLTFSSGTWSSSNLFDARFATYVTSPTPSPTQSPSPTAIPAASSNTQADESLALTGNNTVIGASLFVVFSLLIGFTFLAKARKPL
jgi:hypothetical protein